MTSEHRVSSRQAKALAELYTTHKHELRTLLASNSASSPVPRLVDTHWYHPTPSPLSARLLSPTPLDWLSLSATVAHTPAN